MYKFQIDVAQGNMLVAKIRTHEKEMQSLFSLFSTSSKKTYVVPVSDVSLLGLDHVPFDKNEDRNQMAGDIMKTIMDNGKLRAIYLGMDVGQNSSNNSHPSPSGQDGIHP